MTTFTLLMICIVAQVLIALGLGVHLFRRFRRARRGEKANPAPGSTFPEDKK